MLVRTHARAAHTRLPRLSAVALTQRAAAAAEVLLRPVGRVHVAARRERREAAPPPDPAAAAASARWLASHAAAAYAPPTLLDELLREALAQEAERCAARRDATEP